MLEGAVDPQPHRGLDNTIFSNPDSRRWRLGTIGRSNVPPGRRAAAEFTSDTRIGRSRAPRVSRRYLYSDSPVTTASASVNVLAWVGHQRMTSRTASKVSVTASVPPTEAISGAAA